MNDSRSALPPVLYLVHRIPYPPNKGDKVRSFNILRQLARTHRVFLGTFVDHPDDRQHVGKLSEWCEDVCAIELAPRIGRITSLRGLLSGEALSLPYYRSAQLANWVRTTVVAQGIFPIKGHDHDRHGSCSSHQAGRSSSVWRASAGGEDLL